MKDKFNGKLLTGDEAKELAEKLRKQGKRICFTNGCFDMLHAGHVDSLRKSKAFGDVLFVAVNSDSSIKRYKGKLRPIINEEYRLVVISELQCVDYIILMEEDNASNLIRLIKPEFYIKGEDCKGKETLETKAAKEYGGECEYTAFSNNISTTKIINKIKELDIKK